jgi:hypothetical protein
MDPLTPPLANRQRGVWHPSRQCTATNRAGERCRRQPIPGGEVCVLHGGGSPQVKKSARLRLLEGADLAIDYLLNLLTPKPPCEHCGRSDADRDPTVVRACQLVLDRSGFHPTLTVEHSAAPDKYSGLTIDEFIEKIETTLDQARALRDEQRQREQALLVQAANADALTIVSENGDLSPIQEPDVQIPVATEPTEAGISAPDETGKENEVAS